MASRRGFTLIEVMIVIVVAGLLFMIGLPRLRDAVLRNNVYQSRVALSALYARTRAVSIEQGRMGYLAISGNRVAVLVRLTPTGAAWADTIGVVEDLNERYGVTVTTTDDTIRVDPRGFGLNDLTETIAVSRDGIADTIFISPFGRIQQ
ncbi:MAG TPA: prepilin-type N-terminal cleavage/methylation domain-containing protein [Gemmatimonadales bacterium]|nr:prepilin-type N-terminal cleavage/methylation domain-containing protein [Gemmatimonadales bacterium]